MQLVGTAHGITLENLLMNPTLSDLVGGIDSVTLSDEEARRRGTQKTVLERRAPPTFEVLVEIQDRQTFAIYYNVGQAVDMLLRNKPMQPELRYHNEAGEIQIERPPAPSAHPNRVTKSDKNGNRGSKHSRSEPGLPELEIDEQPAGRTLEPKHIYPYGVGQNRLRQAAKSLGLPVTLVDNLDEADVLMTLKSYYRKHPQPITQAERLGKPVYVLRSNTVVQMEGCLVDIFALGSNELDPASAAIRETQDAIRKVRSGSRSVELTPQTASVRREQHEMVRQAKLISHSLGREPYRRVRIYRGSHGGRKS